MVLVTDIFTIPVGFRFFEPDPVLSAWRKKDKQLRLKGVAKQDRPKRPKPDHQNYPTMQSLALEMLREFVEDFPDVKIKGVLADALYGTGEFMGKASALTRKGQVVSQLRSNQKVASRNSEATVKELFCPTKRRRNSPGHSWRPIQKSDNVICPFVRQGTRQTPICDCTQI